LKKKLKEQENQLIELKSFIIKIAEIRSESLTKLHDMNTKCEQKEKALNSNSGTLTPVQRSKALRRCYSTGDEQTESPKRKRLMFQ
jgi:hypothetical protein